MSEHLISVTELAARLDDGVTRIFDVRHNLMDHAAGANEYQAGHIPGAYFLDNENQLAAAKTGRNGRHPLPEPLDFAALVAAYGVSERSPVVVYDASGGMFAAHLWWMLRWIGHNDVRVLDGGWQAWEAAGQPVERGAASAVVAPVAPRHVDEVAAQAERVSVQDVLDNIERFDFTVIDARAGARYRGEVEPMDPVAGHIPGAMNRPNTENLQADGRFKSPEQLRAEFETLLGDKAPADVVHQCGSGITACHNLLAMEIAGLKGSRLYSGSWSEWCSDASRPVAIG